MPLTRIQKLILLAAWLGWVFDIMDAALFAFAKQPMLTEMLGGEAAYKLHGPGIEGAIQTVFLIGWALGGLVFGILADRWGRTRTLVLTVLMYSLLTGLTALCRTPEQVMVMRFLTALGIGGEWAAGAALVAEALPDSYRPRAAAILQSAAAFGPWFAAGLNLAIPALAWRWLFLVGVIPALIVVAIRLFIPEPDRPAAASEDKPSGSLRELFSVPIWRKHALVAMVLGVVGVTGAGILPFWLPNLVSQAGAGLPLEVVKNFKSYNTFTLHIGTLAGVFLFPYLCDWLGRRRAFALFFVMSPLSLAAAMYGKLSLTGLLILLPVGAFFTIGLSAGFVLYFPELFPARLRATGAGLGYNVGRIASAPMPRLIGGIIDASHGNVAYGVLVSSTVYVLGLLALPFAPETKGKPLP
jgi:MFS family permease